MLIKKNKAEFLNCNLAGFGHTEGYMVLDELKPGTRLTMVREDENKHDHEAIALFYGETHVCYIPRQANSMLATFMDYGYADIFECAVTSVDKDEHPNEQVQIRVNLFVDKPCRRVTTHASAATKRGSTVPLKAASVPRSPLSPVKSVGKL